MNRGLVNLDELRKRFANGEYDFIGNTAYCFLEGNKVIKVYANKKDKSMHEFVYVDPKNICDLSRYEAETIVFPDEYIYEKKLPAAEVSTYQECKKISEAFTDETSVVEITDNFGYVDRDVRSFPNIVMNDLCWENILYSSKLGYRIIDTTPWELANGACSFNINTLNRIVTNTVIKKLEIPENNIFNKTSRMFYRNLNKFGNPGQRLKDNLRLILHDQYNFIDFITFLNDAYRVYSSTDAKTLGDVKEFVKVIKKG